MFQRCPKGSSSWAWRSPQNMSCGGWRTSAPADTAWANAASSVVDLEAEYDGRSLAERGRRQHAHLGELVCDVQRGVPCTTMCGVIFIAGAPSVADGLLLK